MAQSNLTGKEIRIKHVLTGLQQVERWVKSIRETLTMLGDDMVVDSGEGTMKLFDTLGPPKLKQGCPPPPRGGSGVGGGNKGGGGSTPKKKKASKK